MSTTENAVHAGNPRFSNFTRFAALLKDSMSTKRAPTSTQLRRLSTQFEVEDLSQANNVAYNRRSSSTRYTEKMLQMFTHSSRPTNTTLTINDLPVEILQNIFLALDLSTLLRIRRVCKLWKNLVPGESPLLAEELFLKPSYNLYAYSFTMATFDFDFEINVRSPHEHDPYLRSQATFIDGLSLTRRCLGLIRMSSEFIFHPIIIDFNQYVQGDEHGKSKLALQDHSTAEEVHWRNMLVSMPPMTELRISRTVGRKSKTMCTLKAKDGVKLGEVFDTLSNRLDIVANAVPQPKNWQTFAREFQVSPLRDKRLPTEILQNIFPCLDM
ncbi:hypothetical protein BDU57DRAFT_560101 [Ampelomyces quisqualis]|uniref:F-box domain-containing protein n=1 Tax=Ampelomyces quisqualis TaxID=50730 RepID=A0A6A5QA50_AMPQU|nr:hypothetical protein BDU57DRAFT_560101 [Ampelomyces quisqualis]